MQKGNKLFRVTKIKRRVGLWDQEPDMWWWLILIFFLISLSVSLMPTLFLFLSISLSPCFSLHTDLFFQICFIHKARTIMVGGSQVCVFTWMPWRTVFSWFPSHCFQDYYFIFCRITKLKLKYIYMYLYICIFRRPRKNFYRIAFSTREKTKQNFLLPTSSFH